MITHSQTLIYTSHPSTHLHSLFLSYPCPSVSSRNHSNLHTQSLTPSTVVSLSFSPFRWVTMVPPMIFSGSFAFWFLNRYHVPLLVRHLSSYNPASSPKAKQKSVPRSTSCLILSTALKSMRSSHSSTFKVTGKTPRTRLVPPSNARILDLLGYNFEAKCRVNPSPIKEQVAPGSKSARHFIPSISTSKYSRLSHSSLAFTGSSTSSLLLVFSHISPSHVSGLCVLDFSPLFLFFFPGGCSTAANIPTFTFVPLTTNGVQLLFPTPFPYLTLK